VRLRRLLVDRDFEVASATGPIVPLIVGDSGRAVAWADRLQEMGHLVAAIRPPTVPKGTSRLRISLTAAHTEEDVDALVRDLAATAGRVSSPLEV
jgi:8-amino-7-oxononanoate synthase